MKMTDIVGLGVTHRVYQDMCHSKMDTTVSTDRYWLITQQMSMCQARVTNPEACECDFLFPDN
jgi:hypothetical protein